MSDGLTKIELNQNPPAGVTPPVANDTDKPANKKFPWNIVQVILILVAGVGSGYLGSQLLPKSSLSPTKQTAIETTSVPEGGVKVGDTIGLNRESFKDTTVGVLQSGGINGEGTHHLLKPGGVSQTVYLTSSVLDLDPFVGHKVTVWGETFKAQKAGWLMDVGKIRVDELNAPTPSQ